MSGIITIAALLAMLVCVALIPFGLPGLWLIGVVTAGLLIAGFVGWGFTLAVLGTILLVELSEFVVIKRFGDAFGGSQRAFWGALVGGLAGLFVGLPIPIVGSVITAFLGTFVGAGLVTFLETKSALRSARVGWGVLIARTVAVAMKMTAAIGVIFAVSLALFFRR